MTHTSTSSHAHTIARAAGIDAAIVVFTIAAVVLSFATGQGVAEWRNLVFPPIVMAIAAFTLLLVYREVRLFFRAAADSGHRTASAFEVVVPLIAMVIVGPMLLIMPFIFFGALT